MKTILSSIYSFFSSGMASMLSPLGLIVGSAYALITLARELIAEMMTRIDALVVSALPSGVSFAPMGLIDTIVPLHEAIEFFSAWCALYLACAAIRIIKSWVPTVAS